MCLSIPTNWKSASRSLTRPHAWSLTIHNPTTTTPSTHYSRQVKKLRKARAIATGEAARAQRCADDAAIIAATVTGHPDRIDDGAAELPQAIASSVGILHRSQSCYVCKKRYTQVDSFYHLLCPSCARTNHFHRHAGTNLHGRRALLTGGRAKIGMHIALKLLRDGANLTITTRFPRDAARRFSATSDSGRLVGSTSHCGY